MNGKMKQVRRCKANSLATWLLVLLCLDFQNSCTNKLPLEIEVFVSHILSFNTFISTMQCKNLHYVTNFHQGTPNKFHLNLLTVPNSVESFFSYHKVMTHPPRKQIYKIGWNVLRPIGEKNIAKQKNKCISIKASLFQVLLQRYPAEAV